VRNKSPIGANWTVKTGSEGTSHYFIDKRHTINITTLVLLTIHFFLKLVFPRQSLLGGWSKEVIARRIDTSARNPSLLTNHPHPRSSIPTSSFPGALEPRPHARNDALTPNPEPSC
jgi:hypothetical protein